MPLFSCFQLLPGVGAFPDCRISSLISHCCPFCRLFAGSLKENQGGYQTELSGDSRAEGTSSTMELGPARHSQLFLPRLGCLQHSPLLTQGRASIWRWILVGAVFGGALVLGRCLCLHGWIREVHLYLGWCLGNQPLLIVSLCLPSCSLAGSGWQGVRNAPASK